MKESRIKVLHILTRLIAAGADENTIYTVQGINDRYFESHLMVGAESEIIKEVRSRGVTVILIKPLVRNIHLIKDLMALIYIYKNIVRNRYTIVHTHTAKAGILGRIAAKLAGVPVIIHTLHGLSFHEFMPIFQKRLFILLEKLVGRFTDLYISVGENIKWKSINAGIGKANKYITIYSGMNLKKFENVKVDVNKYKESLGIDINDLIIGTVARLEPRKGPHFFIDVISLINQEFTNFKAVIVGIGSFRKQLEKKVRLLGLEKKVIFTGFRSDIAEIMSIFDIICLTSLWEGIPRVLIQGAKLEKPLIAFDIDGNSEIIHDEINGFLISPIDIQTFAKKTLMLLNNEKLRMKMSRQSKLNIDNRWEKEVMVKAIKECYIKLCQRKHIIN